MGYRSDAVRLTKLEYASYLAASLGYLMAFQHDGFWQPMDTLREKQQLESLWQTGKAPWKIWK